MATLMDIVKKGSTNRSVTIRIIDSTDGTPETGVVYNSAGIDLWYRREGAAVTSITEATLAALTTAHSDGGFLHISHGEYRLDLPDAAFATGANYVDIGGTVTGMVVIGGRVRLVDYDPEDTVRLGLTALPNAAADAAGGLPISDAGGLDIDAKLAATNEVTAARMGALTDWINGGRLDLILDTIAADVVNIDGAAMRGTDSAYTGTPPTAAAIADAVWDEATSGHAVGGSFGVAATDTLADTNELQTDDVPGLIAALNDLSAAAVNAEVVDALTVDALSELAQAAPTATPTFEEALMLLYMALRNKVDVTSSTKEIHNDAGTVIAKKALSDDGTTYSEAEMVTGP